MVSIKEKMNNLYNNFKINLAKLKENISELEKDLELIKMFKVPNLFKLIPKIEENKK